MTTPLPGTVPAVFPDPPTSPTLPDVGQIGRVAVRDAVKGKRTPLAVAIRGMSDDDLDAFLAAVLPAVADAARHLPALPRGATAVDTNAAGVELCPTCRTYRPRGTVVAGHCEYDR